MTTAHLFYIPVLLLIGVFAGYFIGRHSMEEELKRRRKKRARREAVRKMKSPLSGDESESSGKASP